MMECCLGAPTTRRESPRLNVDREHCGAEPQGWQFGFGLIPAADPSIYVAPNRTYDFGCRIADIENQSYRPQAVVAPCPS